jgi:hypothetical protein
MALFLCHCELPLLHFGGEAISLDDTEIASGTPALAGGARENKNALAMTINTNPKNIP